MTVIEFNERVDEELKRRMVDPEIGELAKKVIQSNCLHSGRNKFLQELSEGNEGEFIKVLDVIPIISGIQNKERIAAYLRAGGSFSSGSYG
jgi:hypothetical protein